MTRLMVDTDGFCKHVVTGNCAPEYPSWLQRPELGAEVFSRSVDALLRYYKLGLATEPWSAADHEMRAAG